MWFRKRNKEIVLPVLDNDINQILEFGLAMKYLAFSVNDIFLEIECYIFGYAEILHCIRNHYSQFVTDPEKMIYSGFTRKNYSSKLKDIDFLLAEIF